MSIPKIIISEFRNYLLECDRDIQRKFNEYLDKYPYLMFDPFILQTDDDSHQTGFHIGFTNRILKAEEMPKSDVWVETDSSESNVFYVYTPYADVVHFLCDGGYLFVASKDIEPLLIEPVPLSMVEVVPTIKTLGSEVLIYSVLNYINNDSITHEVEDMIDDYITSLIDEGSVRVELIYNDSFTNTIRRTLHGKQTIRIVHENTAIGYISKSGYDLSINKEYVVDLKLWNDLMQKIVDGSEIRDIINNTTVIIDENVDCDVYFAVPGITKHTYNKSS